MKNRLAGRSSVLAGALWLVIASACQSAASSPKTSAGVLRQPQSSFAALVRTLEVVDARHDPRGYVRVRAVESDSILDRQRKSEYARVHLDLTVYARDARTAREVFEDLALALHEEAGVADRFEGVPSHRAARVFQQMNWSAEGLPDDCLSYSDVLRLEVARGRRPSLGVAGLEAPPSEEAPRQPVLEYVNDIAERSSARIGPVETDVRVLRPVRNAREMRVRIRPLSPDAHFTRDKIGAFLSALEEHSPLARITRVEIQRAPHLPNWQEADGWTFEATLTLRQASS